jgi:co-chaperonin GroES (HSP10)
LQAFCTDSILSIPYIEKRLFSQLIPSIFIIIFTLKESHFILENKEADILKELIVIGDRVLIKQDESEEKTKVGLYLPQTVREKEQVISGYIIKTGPGIPLADPSNLGDEPWSSSSNEPRHYLPMEAKPGDYALFLRKASVEITYKNEKYLIVPQSAILVLVREELDDLASDDSDFNSIEDDDLSI